MFRRTQSCFSNSRSSKPMKKSEGQTGFSPILSFYQVPQPKQCPPQAISVPLNVPTEREKTPTTTTKVSFVEFKWQTQNMIFRCLSAVFPWHTAVYSFLACKSSAAHLQRCCQSCPSQENCYQAPDFQMPQLWIPQAPIRGLTWARLWVSPKTLWQHQFQC